MRLGVVDVGTNSVRLLVAEVSGDPPRWRDVERDLLITRLGEGVDRTHALGEAPLRRTVATVAGDVERCRAAGAEPVRVIATSAVRDAANRGVFVDAVRGATGIEPEILSGEAEAALGFRGATAGLDSPGPFLVCDIGGGSTELVRGTSAATRWVSIDIGSVRLTERHVASDPPTAAELAAVRDDADARIDEAVHGIEDERVATLVGLAGTITTVAAMALELRRYDRDAVHRSVLARDRISAIRARLAAMTSAERSELPAMPRGREDVIVAGVVILEAVMDRFGYRDCLVSESDILDGAALELWERARESR